MTQTPAARAFLIFGSLVIGAALTIFVVVVLGYGKTSETTENTGDTKELARQIAAVAARLEDCSTQTGRCYQDNQARTGAAIQTILESSKAQLDPHRLRNEAENLCQVELFSGPVPVATRVPVDHAVHLYKECVLRNSGGTEPPPLPPNPYTTATTTTTTAKRGMG